MYNRKPFSECTASPFDSNTIIIIIHTYIYIHSNALV